MPFILGGLHGLVFLAYRTRVPEPDRWRETKKEARPLQAMVLGTYRRDFV